MPKIFGIPLIGVIQMVLGVVIVLFILIKYKKQPKRKHNGEYVIQDVHILTGDGTESEHKNVYIKKGLIQTISSDPLAIPGAQVIQGKGKTLMPGLIDCHVHIQGLNNRCGADSMAFLKDEVPRIFQEKVFPYGITTIKDLCAPRHFIYQLREQLRSGRLEGPELLIVGPNFTAPDGHPANTLGGDNPWIRKEMAIEVTTPEQVHEGILELKKAGVDFLKFTYQGGDYWYFDKKIPIAKIKKELMEQIIRKRAVLFI